MFMKHDWHIVVSSAILILSVHYSLIAYWGWLTAGEKIGYPAARV